MRALLVVNPKATTTTGRSRDVLATALAAETKLEVVTTTHRGHAVELGRQATQDGLGLVVVLGGDGTINEVVNGMVDGAPGGLSTSPVQLPRLGIVPGGSTNVLARSVGLPRDPVEATGALLEALRAGTSRRIGLGHVAGTDAGGDPLARWFTFTAGVGLDAEAVRNVEKHRKDGRRASGMLYVRETTRHVLLQADRHSPVMEITAPDGALDPSWVCIVTMVAPWTYLGGLGVNTSPRASFETGLDVLGLRRLNRVRLLYTATQLFLPGAGPTGKDVIAHHGLDHLVVTLLRPSALQVDGDHVGDATGPLAFTHTPDALSVVV